MGDIEKAKREIRYAKSAADDRRWDLLATRQGIDAALEGVSDSERAPVLAELAPLRELLAKASREERFAQDRSRAGRNARAKTASPPRQRADRRRDRAVPAQQRTTRESTATAHSRRRLATRDALSRATTP